MKASPWGGGFHVRSRSGSLSPMPKMHGVFTNRDLPSTSTKDNTNRLHVLGFSWITLTNNSKEGFSCMVGVFVRIFTWALGIWTQPFILVWRHSTQWDTSTTWQLLFILWNTHLQAMKEKSMIQNLKLLWTHQWEGWKTSHSLEEICNTNYRHTLYVQIYIMLQNQFRWTTNNTQDKWVNYINRQATEEEIKTPNQYVEIFQLY